MSIPDNFSQWEYNDWQKEQWRMQRPVCEDPRCKKHIQDEHLFYVDGEILCEDCMIRRYRKNTEDFINY